jgi:hypothetical protein
MSSAEQTSFCCLGIGPGGGRKPFTFAALDENRRLLAVSSGPLEDVLAFAAGQTCALAAVCSPRRPNQGQMAVAEVRARLVPAPQPGRWLGYRVAEYELRHRGISVLPTPADEDSAPAWARSGFELYRRLDDLGYRLYPDADRTCQDLETHPGAIFQALLGGALLPRESLEGRLQRQLILYERDVDLADPMEFFEEVTPHRLLHGVLPLKEIYTPTELDALAAAYLAWLAHTQPQKVELLGVREEGQIVIPCPPPVEAPASG